MHLLAAIPGDIDEGDGATDLGQTPADLVILSAADTEIACLAAAHGQLRASTPPPASLRLANITRLRHNLSVDLYVDRVIRHARLVIARLLGGRGYWPHGVDEIVAACTAADIPLALLPGDDQPDPELAQLSRIDPHVWQTLWLYLRHGGPANARALLTCAGQLLPGHAPPGHASQGSGKGSPPVATAPVPPAPVRRAGLYWPGSLPTPATGAEPDPLADPLAAELAILRRHWTAGAPVAMVLFYRALMQANNLAAVDGLLTALGEAGLNPLPLFLVSLRDPAAASFLPPLLHAAPPDIVLNLTGFAVGRPDGADGPASPLAGSDAPVIQLLLGSGRQQDWQASPAGLSPRDIAMQVALPEVDGRITGHAIAFKGLLRRDAASQADILCHDVAPDRLRQTARLAAGWARLRRRRPPERRIALILANYPNRDGRLGNGVGLDTPASVQAIIRALTGAGYRVTDPPADGAALLAALRRGPTNSGVAGRIIDHLLPDATYAAFFSTLPGPLRTQVTERWGPPAGDPLHVTGGFAVPVLRLGHLAVGVQPARGYHIDPVATHHDPALVPPHAYLAFYAWLRLVFRADAVVHTGKHGNLEWLPGKSVALSETCWPDAVLGPMPHLYPFIVNDPGEGTQAKRRSHAVIVDHLTPPMTRAGTYGPLQALEQLIDEYYEAASLDPRRLPPLRAAIIDAARDTGLDRDLGLDDLADPDAFSRLDGYLCELKELQIRDGLHVFGQSPEGDRATGLLAALARLPRGTDRAGAPPREGLTRALAADLGLAGATDGDAAAAFDPLDCDPAQPWTGPRPAALLAAGDAAWRTRGDTVERLESLAARLIAGLPDIPAACCPASWTRTRTVLAEIRDRLAPAVAASGPAEIAGLLRGLDGRFVPPGPSGAPSRGRPEVLPTGRNFFSVDSRALPTPAAWQLGWRSAALLVARHAQEHGDWPKAMVLSAWGTSNMRTGGDDIAQALALLGVQPRRDPTTGRVTGIEIMPRTVLDRPRVDVTLRISGFFRDAFPGLIDLFDSAVRAVAALPESAADNPLAARVRQETRALTATGMDDATAARQAGWRIFGAPPGGYGAGLQALLDSGDWRDKADLAAAFLAWGGHAYGAGGSGGPAPGRLRQRLAMVDGVVHNQDNREHDLLDSDDYYQFEGGLAATVHHLTGTPPPVYHNDHSRPFAPRVRRLEEEIARVIRARATNPKWIAGVMRHGYKGAFELAATVDYTFAFAATTGAVRHDQFDRIYDAYLADDRVRDFIETHNPDALADIAARLIEAARRGLWRPRANSALPRLAVWAARPARPPARPEPQQP